MFDNIIGNEQNKKILKDIIKSNNVAHSYMFVGKDSVGKMLFAREFARALLCTNNQKPCNTCKSCIEFESNNNPDFKIIEPDGNSVKIDQIRQLVKNVYEKPIVSNKKVYIINSGNLMTKEAQNSLLKTLEEPPAHVKFIFATTEIRKVPVTVLSRCQRFDLQRLSIEDLLKLFHKIVEAEKLKADEEALHMIAKAADGSARDGLSLLDQAISLGAGVIKADIVKDMIGLADITQTFELFENLINGETKQVIITLQEQYKNGADPVSLLKDLISLTHLITKVKLVPSFINDSSVSEAEKDFCNKVKDKISIAILSKIWQMMIKGMSELQLAPLQIDALEMILIRVAYSASLPTPYELLNDVKKNSDLRVIPQTPSTPQPILTPSVVQTEPEKKVDSVTFNSIEELVKFLEDKKYPLLVYSLKHDVSIQEFSDGQIKMTVADSIHPEFIQNFIKILRESTGKNWDIEILKGVLGETLADKENAAIAERQRDVMEYPLVRAIMAEFKGAKIESLTRCLQDKTDDENIETTNDLIFDEDNEA